MKINRAVPAIIASLALTLALASPAAASPTTFPFKADNLYLAGFATCPPLTRDFNGDRRVDIATGGDGHWDLLLGKARDSQGRKGQFATTPSHPSNGCPVAAVDFNRDGRLDVATAGASGAQIWLGNGDGSFAAPVNFATGSRGLQAVGDLNGDAWPDLVLVDDKSLDYNVAIRYGNALGFSPEQLVPVKMRTSYGGDPIYMDRVAVSDLNGDRRPDLIAGGYSYEGSSDVVTLLNGGRAASGNAVFAQTSYVGSSRNSSRFVASDFNQDGIRDLLLASTDIQSPLDIRLGLGNGKGGFSSFVSLGGGLDGVRQPAIGDFDRDGRRDIAFGTTPADPFNVRFGRGDGTFDPALRAGQTTPPRPLVSLARANVNHDGRPDIVAVDASTSHSGVIVYFNTLR